MSIQTELTRITNAKAAIKAAIEGKGVTVPAGTLLDGMASLIESIAAGGGGENVLYGEISVSTDAASFGLEIEKPNNYENGTVPAFAVAWNSSDFLSNASSQATVKCLFLATDGISGFRRVSGSYHEELNLNSSTPSSVCQWYGIKLWFYGSIDANYKAFRAGDIYKYIVIL